MWHIIRIIYLDTRNGHLGVFWSIASLGHWDQITTQLGTYVDNEYFIYLKGPWVFD